MVVACVFAGAIGSVPLVWALADTFSGLMATVNLLAILPMGGIAVALLKDYADQKKRGLDPKFHRDNVPGIRGWDGMECWDGSDPLTR